MRADFDTTCPFGNWQREKTNRPKDEYKPPRTHSRLVANPTPHVILNGEVALVVRYIGDLLWKLTVAGREVIAHELDCSMLSRDWLYHS